MLINTSVDETHLQMLINCQTFEDMWSRLIVVHKQSSRENVHLLQGNFLGYKMWKGDIIGGHILKIKNMAWRLNNLGECIPNSM
jgi:hypothetical protein